MRKVISIVFIIVFCLLTAVLNSGCNRQINESNVFGTFIEIKLEGINSIKAEKQIRAKLEEIENLFSVNIENSDIYKFNNLPINTELAVNEQTVSILKVCKDVYDYTDGAFNPAIFPLVKLWGFEAGSLFNRETIPTDAEINNTLKNINFKDLIIDENNKTIKKLSDIKIDLGGIAKGYAVGQCAQICKKLKVTGLTNIGGNIYCLKQSNIGISNPRASSFPYNGIVTLNDTSISTSGDYERFYIINGERYHHIIGKDGKPVKNGIMSVTVISSDTSLCDALSTAVFVIGKEKALDIIKHYNAYCIILTEDKEIYTYGEGYTYSIKDTDYSFEN
jgi:thiamine biosynthesis lipoprotein